MTLSFIETDCGWAATDEMRAKGISEEAIKAEVDSWREDGWEPMSETSGDIVRAFLSYRNGYTAVGDELVRPYLERYGAKWVHRMLLACDQALERLRTMRETFRN